MILEPPASVQKLQAALQAKAKEAPSYRFYLLYDKLYRKDVLEYAYRCCKANAGAPGVDGQDFADVEAYGVERWLGELAEKLCGKTYRAEACDACGYPRRTAANGRSGSRRSERTTQGPSESLGWAEVRLTFALPRESAKLGQILLNYFAPQIISTSIQLDVYSCVRCAIYAITRKK